MDNIYLAAVLRLEQHGALLLELIAAAEAQALLEGDQGHHLMNGFPEPELNNIQEEQPNIEEPAEQIPVVNEFIEHFDDIILMEDLQNGIQPDNQVAEDSDSDDIVVANNIPNGVQQPQLEESDNDEPEI